jgi:hypothetical protein
MHKFFVWAAALICLEVPSCANAQDDDSGPAVTASAGIDYSSGRYGLRQGTDIVVGLSEIALTTGSFRFSASVPYFNIEGPSYVVVGSGGAPVLINPKAGSDSTIRDGWGDLNLGVTYSWLPQNLDGYEFDFTGRTKFATADAAKGLSTGETDFSFSVDASREIGAWTPFVSFGYLVPGSPSAYSLNSAPQFSVGTSVQLGDDVVAMASYDFNGAINSSLSDAQQLFASASWLFNKSLGFTVYAETGFTSGAPSVGTGLLVSWRMPV